MNMSICPATDSAANRDLQAIALANEAQPVERPHTLNSIAAECEASKRSTQNWLKKAVDKYGELGELREGARYFSDAEREQVLEFASSRKAQASQQSAPVSAEVIEGDPVDTPAGALTIGDGGTLSAGGFGVAGAVEIPGLSLDTSAFSTGHTSYLNQIGQIKQQLQHLQDQVAAEEGRAQADRSAAIRAKSRAERELEIAGQEVKAARGNAEQVVSSPTG